MHMRHMTFGKKTLQCCGPQQCFVHLTAQLTSVQSYPYEGVTNYCKKDWGETVKFKKASVLQSYPAQPCLQQCSPVQHCLACL